MLADDLMLGLVVWKVVLSILTNLRRDSTLENDVDVAPFHFDISKERFQCKIPSYFRTGSGTKSAGIAIW